MNFWFPYVHHGGGSDVSTLLVCVIRETVCILQPT